MRFSDLKKIKAASRAKPASPGEEKPRPPEAPEEEQAAPAKQLPEAPPPAPEPPPQAAEERSAPTRRSLPRNKPAPETPYALLEKEARGKYASLITQVDLFLKAVEQPYCERYEEVLAACVMTADTLRHNPALLTCTNFSTADDYLRAHTANTVILSLAMGLRAGLDRQEMNLLGFCAMAHDIGMTGFAGLYSSKEPLSEEEQASLALHSEAGAEKLDRIVDLDYKVRERAKRIILQIHEREDGSGYPDRVSGEEIDPLASIISIANAYEALTHPRSWRESVDHPEAIKELISRENRGFNLRAVKLIVSVLTIFPPGSIVKLSTGETARVLKVNQGLLTRPLVEILLEPDFSQAEPRLSDLKHHPLVSIENALTFKELRSRCPKCAARLEMSRWWTDW